MPNLKVGTITHFFDKISVAVVDLVDTLSVGDKVKIGDPGFIQNIESIQEEHEQVDSSGKGKSVGLKVSQPVNEGDEVVRV